MKPLFITLSLLLMFSNVHADKLSTVDETTGDQSLFNDDDTYFNQIGDMFNQGTLPTAEETLGWWSGRCFQPNSPNRTSDGLFVFRADDSQGPAFPLSYQIFGFGRSNNPADYYDTLTDAIEVKVREFIVSSHARGFDFTAREKNGSWFTRETTKIYAQELRKYQDYFVMRVFSSEGDELTVISYCYYFKKIYSY